MSSSSRRQGPINVPPPVGGKPASTYARFIPREELGDFAAWNPDSLSGRGPRGSAEAAPAAPPPPPPAPEPTVEEWLAEVAAARQAGYQDGYRDGLVALESFKQSYATQLTAQFTALSKNFGRELDALEAQVAEAVARTAVQLARQVVRGELKVDPALVARVASEAVESVLLSARHITVHLHPQDLALVAEGAADAIEARGARLMANAGIARGGCQVDSDAGSIDARIATRWAQAAGALGLSEPWDGPDAEEASAP